MNSQLTRRAIFLAGMVFASTAVATDINKCVTAAGSVTLTDEVCPGGTQTVKVISVPTDTAGEEAVPSVPSVSAASVTPARPGIERYPSQRMPTRYATVVRSQQPQRGLSLDMATLKAARANLASFDIATQAMRSQRLAGLQ